MDQTRWKIVAKIFHDAIDLTPDAREHYVAEAAGGDKAIEEEVARLLRADSEAATYLEKPITRFPSFERRTRSDSPFTPGDILKDRYQIVRLVGEGGMGYVLEAVDLELNVRVAIKAIRPEIAIHASMLELFRREVRTARSITHRNVCRTYDFNKGSVTHAAEAEEFLFLTMEFLEGETLAERLKRTGPLPLPEALDILRQIAQGLDCSHEAGVIHRDIKPGNIMLVPESSGLQRAVIMDFGLARIDPRYQLSQAPSLSGLVGTLAYMAPEQMIPGATTSPATDVYAFGLVVREGIAGHLEFDKLDHPDNIHADAEQVRSSTQLPDSWIRAIDGCLQTDPRKRFQSAGEVINALERPDRSTSLRTTVSNIGRRIGITGRTASVTFLVTMSLFLAWLRFHNQEIESRVEPGTYLYIAPLKNETSVRQFSGIAELLRTALSQSTQFDLLSQAKIGDTLQMMNRPPDITVTEPIAREIAMRNDAPRLVFATIKGSGTSYQLDIQIQETDNTPTHYRKQWLKSFEWQQNAPTSEAGPQGTIAPELLGAVRDASDWIRERVGESPGHISQLNGPLDDVTTSKWEALEEYNNAMTAQQQRKTDDAIQFLDQAVKIDPGFALAYARLGDLESDLDRFRDGIAAYQKALEVSEDKRLTRRERDRIRGQFAMDSGDYLTAENAFRDYTLFYSSDFRGYFYQGYPLMMLERFDEAENALRKSLELKSDEISPLIQLACLYMVVGDLSRARGLMQKELTSDRSADANKILGEIAFLESDFDGSEKYFETMQRSSDPFAKVMSLSLLARLNAERGQYIRSLDYLDQTIRVAREEGDRAEESALLDRAYLDAEDGNYQKALEETKSAIDLDQSLQRITFASAVLGNASLRATAPVAEAIRKQLAKLDGLIQPNDAIILSRVVKHRVDGESLLANRRWKQAVGAMRAAAKLDAPLNPKEYLARALVVAAAHESDPATALAFRNDAIREYEVCTRSPGVTWSIARQYPPGFLANQLVALFSLTGKNSKGIERLIPQWRRLSALRASSIDTP